MVVQFRGPQPNYEVAAGGAIPDGTRVRDLGRYGEAVQPRMTPLLTRVGIGEGLNVDPPEWGQKHRGILETTLNAGVTNVATTFVFAASTGVRLMKYHVLKVTNYFAGTTRLDNSNAEIVWLNGDMSADTNTSVVRAMGSTTGKTHDAGAKVEIIGIAVPQLQFFPLGSIIRGTIAFNYFERFAQGVAWDKATLNTRTFEFPNGNPAPEDIEETQVELKLLLERSMWHSGRQPGSNTTGQPSMMGGFDTFITSNVTNVGSAKLTPALLEAEIRDLWKTVDDSAGKALLMSVDTAAIFDTLLNPIKTATVNDTSASFYLERIRFRSGTYDIGVSRHCPDGTIYIVNFDAIKVHPRAGCNWQMSKVLGENQGTAHDKHFIWGDFTMKLRKEATMAKLWNFNTDLNLYPLATL
jgi:hypothetical protein